MEVLLSSLLSRPFFSLSLSVLGESRTGPRGEVIPITEFEGLDQIFLFSSSASALAQILCAFSSNSSSFLRRRAGARCRSERDYPGGRERWTSPSFSGVPSSRRFISLERMLSSSRANLLFSLLAGPGARVATPLEENLAGEKVRRLRGSAASLGAGRLLTRLGREDSTSMCVTPFLSVCWTRLHF